MNIELIKEITYQDKKTLSERASERASDKGGNYGSITFDNRNI